MNENKHKLTLYQSKCYRIVVPGHLDETWSRLVAGMAIEFKNDEDGVAITILTCTLDQAALHSLLRRLYSLGLPLISVTIYKSDISENSS